MTTRIARNEQEVASIISALQNSGFQPVSQTKLEDGRIRIVARSTTNPSGRDDIQLTE